MVYYIETGAIELHWEAELPVALSTVFSAALQQYPTSLGTNSSSRFLDTADSIAFAAPQTRALHRPTEQRELQPQDTMAMTLEQAMQRAEALMQNAAGGSIDNLLVSFRRSTQFVGALSMLDPTFVNNRWRASARAHTTTEVVQMNREGLDSFLLHNPLAQVHLRASMARARAEITKLEALEKIAEKRYKGKVKKGMSFKKPVAGQGGVGGAAAANDLFAVVSKLRDSLKEGLMPSLYG